MNDEEDKTKSFVIFRKTFERDFYLPRRFNGGNSFLNISPEKAIKLIEKRLNDLSKSLKNDKASKKV